MNFTSFKYVLVITSISFLSILSSYYLFTSRTWIKNFRKINNQDHLGTFCEFLVTIIILCFFKLILWLNKDSIQFLKDYSESSIYLFSFFVVFLFNAHHSLWIGPNRLAKKYGIGKENFTKEALKPYISYLPYSTCIWNFLVFPLFIVIISSIVSDIFFLNTAKDTLIRYSVIDASSAMNNLKTILGRECGVEYYTQIREELYNLFYRYSWITNGALILIILLKITCIPKIYVERSVNYIKGLSLPFILLFVGLIITLSIYDYSNLAILKTNLNILLNSQNKNAEIIESLKQIKNNLNNIKPLFLTEKGVFLACGFTAILANFIFFLSKDEKKAKSVIKSLLNMFLPSSLKKWFYAFFNITK